MTEKFVPFELKISTKHYFKKKDLLLMKKIKAAMTPSSGRGLLLLGLQEVKINMNPTQLDKAYHKFISNLPSWIPDGMIEVDLALLEKTGLLQHETFNDGEQIEQLPHYFHVIETSDKVTLFNHQFVIWIVPKVADEIPITMVLIALMKTSQPHLEIVFSTKGVYNTPKFVLRLLKYYLSEVIDTEEAISSISQD